MHAEALADNTDIKGVEHRRGAADAPSLCRNERRFRAAVDTLNQAVAKNGKAFRNLLCFAVNALFYIAAVRSIGKIRPIRFYHDSANNIILFKFVQSAHNFNHHAFADRVERRVIQRDHSHALYDLGFDCQIIHICPFCGSAGSFRQSRRYIFCFTEQLFRQFAALLLFSLVEAMTTSATFAVFSVGACLVQRLTTM